MTKPKQKNPNDEKVFIQLTGFTRTTIKILARHTHLSTADTKTALDNLIASGRVKKLDNLYSV